MKKEKLKSKNYNTARSVGILLVFFFTLFSFGKSYVHADIIGDVYYESPTSVADLPSVYGSFGAWHDQTTKQFFGSKFINADAGSWDTMDIVMKTTDNTQTDESEICIYNSSKTLIQCSNEHISPTDFSANNTNLPITLTFTPAITFSAGQTYYIMHHKISGSNNDPSWNYCDTFSNGSCRETSNGQSTNHSQFSSWNNDQSNFIDGDYAVFNMKLYTGIPPVFTSEITSFTYATSTQTVNIQGFWNVPSDPFQSEQLEFWQTSTALGQESYVAVTATTSGAFNFTFPYKILPTPGGATTTAPILETIYFTARLSLVDGNYYDPFGLNGLDTSLYKTTIDNATLTLTELTHDLDTPIGLLEYPEYECAITSITGCLKNAGIWLFYPSSQKIEQFKSLSTDLQGKFPFAYAYGINQMRQELFSASSTPQTISLTFKIIPGHGTSTLELISQDKLSAVPYANTVKTILGWILWLLAIEYIYYRVIRAHDPNTPS